MEVEPMPSYRMLKKGGVAAPCGMGISVPPCAGSAIGTAAERIAIGATLIQVEPFQH